MCLTSPLPLSNESYSHHNLNSETPRTYIPGSASSVQHPNFPLDDHDPSVPSTTMLPEFHGQYTHALAVPLNAAYTAGWAAPVSQPHSNTLAGLVVSPHATLDHQCPAPGHATAYANHAPATGIPLQNHLPFVAQVSTLGHDSPAWASESSAAQNPADWFMQDWLIPDGHATNGQDTDATDHLVTASQSPAAMSMKSPSSVQPESITPTFVCLINGCGEQLPVDLPTLERHLGAIHLYPARRRGHALDCRWTGCECKLTGCKGRPYSHGAHSEDITSHVWNHHLSFQDPCSKCGEVGWLPGFSKKRHEAKCAGRKPARCRTCYILFDSEAGLAGHFALDMCPKRAGIPTSQ
jgi:hypothetical protein